MCASTIIPGLYSRLRTVLARCGPFTSDKELKALFVDARISGWRGKLREADSSDVRVSLLIDSLCGCYNNAQENALVLFLHVLVDQTDMKDECYHRLMD